MLPMSNSRPACSGATMEDSECILVRNHAPAGLAIRELCGDPGIGVLHACAQEGPGLPMKDLLDESVVAIAAGDAFRRGRIVGAREVHAGDLLRSEEHTSELQSLRH